MGLYFPHFIGRQTEAQAGKVPGELGFLPSLSDFRAFGLWNFSAPERSVLLSCLPSRGVVPLSELPLEPSVFVDAGLVSTVRELFLELSFDKEWLSALSVGKRTKYLSTSSHQVKHEAFYVLILFKLHKLLVWGVGVFPWRHAV